MTEEETRSAELKRHGQQLVWDADPFWRTNAVGWIYHKLKPDTRFTTDDVIAAVGLPTRRNAVGALMTYLAKKGLIERVGTRRSRREKSRLRLISVWRRLNPE